METILEFYRNQGVSEGLLKDIEKFRSSHPVAKEAKNRVMPPQISFYGKEIFEMAAAALLQGENILLSGTKATGKNVLAENLAWVFGRPVYNISFNINTDSASLIGTDTFRNNEVCLRRGPVYDCAVYGGFGIFDEINMAKNDAVSVLHAVLDYRRVLDVPGYERIELDSAARFIGTMNYGYAGTKELNEALVSRFMVIDMPPIEEDTLFKILKDLFPEAKDEGLLQLGGFFMDLQLKASHNEISTKALDLRGLIGALKTIQAGLTPARALRMGIINKSFDVFEREIIEDIAETRIPEGWSSREIFEDVHEL
ncbi:MAG: MoxR family ATPase [Eubacteriales bacterium]|nr:MoxR family ATPase [Eubacteriales bacterium]